MSATEGLEDKLNQILNDPNSMAQILSLAQSFGMQSEPEPSAAPPSAPAMGAMPDEGFLLSIMQMMQQAQKSDAKQEALLCALKPYLAPERREKLDRAMQLARLSHIAGFALRNSGGLLGNKEG